MSELKGISIVISWLTLATLQMFTIALECEPQREIPFCSKFCWKDLWARSVTFRREKLGCCGYISVWVMKQIQGKGKVIIPEKCVLCDMTFFIKSVWLSPALAFFSVLPNQLNKELPVSGDITAWQEKGAVKWEELKPGHEAFFTPGTVCLERVLITDPEQENK